MQPGSVLESWLGTFAVGNGESLFILWEAYLNLAILFLCPHWNETVRGTFDFSKYVLCRCIVIY